MHKKFMFRALTGQYDQRQYDQRRYDQRQYDQRRYDQRRVAWVNVLKIGVCKWITEFDSQKNNMPMPT